MPYIGMIKVVLNWSLSFVKSTVSYYIVNAYGDIQYWTLKVLVGSL